MDILTTPVDIRNYVKCELNNNWRKIHGKHTYRWKHLNKARDIRIRRYLRMREELLFEWFDKFYKSLEE